MTVLVVEVVVAATAAAVEVLEEGWRERVTEAEGVAVAVKKVVEEEEEE